MSTKSSLTRRAFRIGGLTLALLIGFAAYIHVKHESTPSRAVNQASAPTSEQQQQQQQVQPQGLAAPGTTTSTETAVLKGSNQQGSDQQVSSQQVSDHPKASASSAPAPGSAPFTAPVAQASPAAAPSTAAPTVASQLVPSQANKTGQTGPAAVPSKPVQTCFKLTYHHQATAGHTDREACSNHRNLIQLKQKDVNKKSICVRVDGTPAHYQPVPGKSDFSLIVDPVAGPKSKIQVSYCIGKNMPEKKEDCSIPKDEFLGAIGAEEEGNRKIAQWDPNDNSKDSDVSADLESQVNDLAGASMGLFKGWIEE